MTLRLAVLGDSIGAGQGAARPGDTLAPRLVAGLAEHDIAATSRVVAVSGSRSSALDAQVDQVLGWAPDLAVVVIGANDLSHRTPPEQAGRDLGDAVRRLREVGAEVVVVPAPDLSAVPHVPPGLRELLQVATQRLREHQVAATLREGGRVADPEGTAVAAFAADGTLFSSDRFHPSSAGYAVIAATLLPEVLAAATVHRERSA